MKWDRVGAGVSKPTPDTSWIWDESMAGTDEVVGAVSSSCSLKHLSLDST